MPENGELTFSIKIVIILFDKLKCYSIFFKSIHD